MTKEQLAERLNGKAYGNEIDKATEKLAKDAGLVVVFGYSDDGMEFRGAISEEVGAPDTVALSRQGLYVSRCGEGDDCPYFKQLKKGASTIEALWCAEKDGPSWTYKTTIPHATFDIQSDDEDEGIYCRGIVFDLTDVP